MTQQPATPRKTPRVGRDVMIASICGFVVALMVGASYAAVPFYNWFCRTTGFNGTTQVATSAPAASLERRIAVRFDANVSGGLPWKFEPEQTEISVKIGEVVTGRKQGRTSDDDVTLFDSTGIALQDSATVPLEYKRAMEAGVGIEKKMIST